MKTSISFLLIFSLLAPCTFAQNKEIDKYFRTNPVDIKVNDTGIQEYEVTLKWQNLDAISGQKINCNIVQRTYLTGQEDGFVAWKDVSLAQVEDFRQTQFTATELPAFDNFSYKAMDTAFLAEEFYKDIPMELRDLAKWLVSDAIQMQGLSWYVFDSLSYNEEFIPKLLENYDITFEDWVTFSSRYQKLIWSGIGKHNNEICAIIKFESYYNPISIENENMSVKGRALYYGEMWVSLEDKQVEFASMLEDDIFKIQSSQFQGEQLLDLQREVVFNKRTN